MSVLRVLLRLKNDFLVESGLTKQTDRILWKTQKVAHYGLGGTRLLFRIYR